MPTGLMNGLRAGVLLATLALVAAGCGTGDFAPTVRFDGTTYVASVPHGLMVDDGDLVQIGEVEEIGETAHVQDGIVFSLRGVDPRKIILLKAPEPQTEGSWLMMIGEGTLFGSGPPELFKAVPELCPYFPNEAACNTSTGYNGGTLITTETGTNQFAGEAVLGQSNGYLAGPASCKSRSPHPRAT